MKVDGAIFNYRQYMDWMETLASEDKISDSQETKELVSYTTLNLKRMKRLYKTVEIDNGLLDLLAEIKDKQIWYVIAEVWCGDCAQNLPIISKIADSSNGLIDLKIISRDDNPEWMEKYHTLGSKSIPKLISFNRFGVELFTWGPRPKPAQQILENWKSNPNGKSWDDFEKDLHTWYAQNKSKSIQYEFYQILSKNINNNSLINFNNISNN